MNGKWRGTALFLAIFVVMGATFGLRLYSSAPNSADTTSRTPKQGSPTAAGRAGPSAAKPTSGPSPAAAVSNITGATESTPYGNVQVAVSFSGKKITGVTVLQVPNSGNYDQRVAQAVPPILLQEILSSQSAAVNTVSGGTYTSVGYLQSVQSAIDKLR